MSCLHLHAHMHFGSSLSLSCHLHGHPRACGLFTLILPFCFLLYLPHLFLFLNYLKSVVNLHNSCNESMDSTDEFSLSTENWCLPASTLKPEEREYVVDSGASMLMISKKDLSDAEMDTLTKSCTPTTVITANGEVQTHEEATVYVKELDICLTMKVLDNTPAVLSLGKLCDENGFSYKWINGQKPHLINNGIRIICNTENFVPIVVPGLSNSSSRSDSSTSTTLSRQESHCSTSSSSSSSSPTVSDTKPREREDRIESDISPVQVSTTVDERSGRPDIDQASKNPKTKKTERTERHVVDGTGRPVIF